MMDQAPNNEKSQAESRPVSLDTHVLHQLSRRPASTPSRLKGQPNYAHSEVAPRAAKNNKPLGTTDSGELSTFDRKRARPQVRQKSQQQQPEGKPVPAPKTKASTVKAGTLRRTDQWQSALDSASKPPKGRRKRKVSKEVERDIRRAVKTEVKKRQTEARSRVSQAFQCELAASRVHMQHVEIELPADPPPQPTGSVLEALSVEQGNRLVASWNYLHTFARPLGLLHVPSLPELLAALRTLTESQESTQQHMDARRLMDEICIALVRSITPDLESIVGLRNNKDAEDMKELFARQDGLLLPINILTWKEIARQCLLMAIYKGLMFPANVVSEIMRGRNQNHRRSKFFLTLVHMRLQARPRRKLQEEQAGTPEQKPSNTHPTSKPPSAIEAPSQDPLQAPIDCKVTNLCANDVHAADTTSAAKPQDPTRPRISVSAPMLTGPSKDFTTCDGGASNTNGGAHVGPNQQKDETEGSEGKAGLGVATTQTAVMAGEGPRGARGREGPKSDREDLTEADSETASRRQGQDGESETNRSDMDSEEEDYDDQDEEVARELDELILGEDMSEDEKRMACIFKRLPQYRTTENVNGEGSQSREGDSSLGDYQVQVWQPLTLLSLVGRLREGRYRGQEGVRRCIEDVDTLCRNSLACNLQDSEGWTAAEKLQATFDRLVKSWILDPQRPALHALSASWEPCPVCRLPITKNDMKTRADKLVCGRCQLNMHKFCALGMDASFALEEMWACDDCIAMSIRQHDYLSQSLISHKPQVPAGILLELGDVSEEVRAMLQKLVTHIGDYGCETTCPPMLDLSICRTLCDFFRDDSEHISLLAAFAWLADRTHDSDHVDAMTQYLILMDVLCQYSATASHINDWLEKQDQRVNALRRKMPDDEAALRTELQAIAGDAAVLAWKDPSVLEEDKEDDEEEAEREWCVKCDSTTKDVPDHKVVLCEQCPTEIHLRCLDPAAEKVPDKPWYCPRCRAAKNKRKRHHRPEELQDVLEDARVTNENALLERLLEERIEEHVVREEEKAQQNLAESQTAATNTAAGGTPSAQTAKGAKARGQKGQGGKRGAAAAAARPTCEYCGFSELELCSPLVLGQRPEETREHLRLSPDHESWVRTHLKAKSAKTSATAKPAVPEASRTIGEEGEEEEPQVTLVPFFPRPSTSAAAKMSTYIPYPIAHEKCAIQMLSHRARALHEQMEGDKTERDEKERALDQAIKISGTRIYPLGEDRHRRTYWQLAGDSSRLFVWISGSTASEGQTYALSGKGQWQCYEKVEDIQALIDWLDARSQRESRLKRAVKQMLGKTTKPRPEKERDGSIILRRQSAQSFDTCNALGEEEGQDGLTHDAATEPSHGQKKADAAEAEDSQSHTDPLSATHSQVASAAGQEPIEALPQEGSTSHQEDQGVRTTQQEDASKEDVSTAETVSEGVEQRNAAGQERTPVALKFVEEKCQVDIPGEVVEIEVDADLWGAKLEERTPIRRTRKCYALALVDKDNQIYEERNVGVKFEIWKGGDMLEHFASAKAHKDFLFWFHHHDFILPGTYTLRFNITSDLSHQIRPLILRVEVKARRETTSIRSILNELCMLKRSRSGRHSSRATEELAIPEDADLLTGLRAALSELRDSLPGGSLVESVADLPGYGKGSKDVTRSAPFLWDDITADAWTSHLIDATSARELMEALIILEGCIHPDWLKPWYPAMKRCFASSPTQLLRHSTLSHVAFHLLILDKAIHFDKERPAARRTRQLDRAQKAKQQVKPQAEVESLQPYRRSTQTSRLAEMEESRAEEDDEEYGADDAAAEENGFLSDEDGGADDSDSSRKRQPGRAAKRKGRRIDPTPRTSKRKRTAVNYADYDVDPGDDLPGPYEDDFTSGGFGGRLRQRARVNYREMQDEGDEEEPPSAQSQQQPHVTTADSPTMTGGGSMGNGAVPGLAEESRGEVKEDEGFCKMTKKVLKKMKQADPNMYFYHPVPDTVPGYYEVIQEPMCISLLHQKVKQGDYKGSIDLFEIDARKLWENTIRFNGLESFLTQVALQLKNIFEEWANQVRSSAAVPISEHVAS